MRPFGLLSARRTSVARYRTNEQDGASRPSDRAILSHGVGYAATAVRQVGFTVRAYSVPGTADISRTQRTTRVNLNGDTSDIPPAQSTFRQVTPPPAESARGHFQADDAGSIPVVRSTRCRETSRTPEPSLGSG